MGVGYKERGSERGGFLVMSSNVSKGWFRSSANLGYDGKDGWVI